jgi:rubrerythrin
LTAFPFSGQLIRRYIRKSFIMSELEIMWRCLKCGEMWPDKGEPLPEKCPHCGAPKTEFELVQED